MPDLGASTALFDAIWTRSQQSRPGGMQAEACAEWMAALYRHLEVELQALDRSRIACAAGCADCCVVDVAVLMPEAIAVVEFLRQLESSGAGAAMRERVAALDRTIGGLNAQERLRLQLPCAFLSDRGSCLIYPMRPLMCRSVSSTDPASCRAALTAQDEASAPPVVMNLQQKQLCDQAFFALAEVLKGRGLDDRSASLNSMVYHLLRQPQLAAAWLQGGPVPQNS